MAKITKWFDSDEDLKKQYDDINKLENLPEMPADFNFCFKWGGQANKKIR